VDAGSLDNNFFCNPGSLAGGLRTAGELGYPPITGFDTVTTKHLGSI